MQPLIEHLAAKIHDLLQEQHAERALDSIEQITVRAYLASVGIEYPNGVALPSTIKEWVEWTTRCSIPA